MGRKKRRQRKTRRSDQETDRRGDRESEKWSEYSKRKPQDEQTSESLTAMKEDGSVEKNGQS